MAGVLDRGRVTLTAARHLIEFSCETKDGTGSDRQIFMSAREEPTKDPHPANGARPHQAVERQNILKNSAYGQSGDTRGAGAKLAS